MFVLVTSTPRLPRSFMPSMSLTEDLSTSKGAMEKKYSEKNNKINKERKNTKLRYKGLLCLAFSCLAFPFPGTSL